ncbi:pyruvate formate-lyase-activating protein [Actinomycetaceae bacterium MB13-C1-2]|nr:pyruvate formate-lyase-activating protein [Actinomycetaceae bacterium MB13-C1-2]
MSSPGRSTSASDGVAGFYSPAPLETPVARIMGAGLSGLDSADDLERVEQARMIHSGELMSVHSWELVTAVDGPGTRMTTFLSGCPLRCLYCHNPDTLDMRRGTMIPTEELMERMLRYKRIFDRTGGGITMSGGEPLMQPAGIARIFEFAKENGIHTALDTTGFLGWRCTDEMLSNLDLCLLDIKSGTEKTYRALTSRELQPTIEFAKRLSDAEVSVWVRFVLVPGHTDSADNIREVAEIASTITSLERLEVLPFHQMGRDKWHALGLPYLLDEVEPPTPGETEAARDIFREMGIPTF